MSLETLTPPTSHVSAFVRRHPLRTYLVIFTVFGQPLAFLPLIVSRLYGVQLDTDLVLIVPTLLFILLPALLITLHVRGRDGLRALIRQMVRFDVSPRWYLLPLLVMPVLSVAATFALPADGLHPATLATVYLTGFLPALMVTFLTTNWWEETLWTGFFQGTLQERGHSAVRAALITTPFFALQHIALGPTGTVAQWLTWLAILTVAIIPVRFLFAWLYNRTGSIALV
ncbi:MAG TPA: CPBP family intramembrane glutamic endopeptidase, partial [Actinoplanes sp.]